jgi:hypothetical protein
MNLYFQDIILLGYEGYTMNAAYGGYSVPASSIPSVASMTSQMQPSGYGTIQQMVGGPQAPASHATVTSSVYGAASISHGYGVQGGYYQQPAQPSDSVQAIAPYPGSSTVTSSAQQTPYGQPVQLSAAPYGQAHSGVPPAQPIQAGGYGVPAVAPAGGYYGAQTAPNQMPQSGYYPGPQQPGGNQQIPTYGQPFPGAPPPRMMRGGPPQGMFRGGPRGGFSGFSGGNGFVSNFEDENAIRPDTVHVSSLPSNLAEHEKLKQYFGVVGKIKMNAKTGMPMIWIFKESGVPRGDAVITYESNTMANAAVKHFQENDLAGHKVEVRLATNAERPKIVPPGGGAASNASRGGMSNRDRGGFENGQGASRGGMGGPRRGSPNGTHGSSAAGRGGRGGGGAGAGAASRDGDWTCSDCGNSNFAWRDTCNRCQSNKAGGSGNGMVGGPMRGGARAPRPAPY